MDKQSYSDLLKDPRWQKRRLQILERDGWKCSWCGDEKSTLHVHHFAYLKNPWDAGDGDLCTLCEDCHSIEHSKKNLSRFEIDLVNMITDFWPVSKVPHESRSKTSLLALVKLSHSSIIRKKKRLAKLLKNG